MPPLKIGRQESIPLLKDGIPLSCCNLFYTWYVSCDQNMLLRRQYYICNLRVVIEVVLGTTKKQYPLELSAFLQISLREKTMLSPQNGQWLYAFVSRTHD